MSREALLRGDIVSIPTLGRLTVQKLVAALGIDAAIVEGNRTEIQKIDLQFSGDTLSIKAFFHGKEATI